MGTFSVAFEVGNQAGTKFIPLEGLVDTGSTYTSIGEDVLRSLGVTPKGRRGFLLATDQRIEYEVGETLVKIGEAFYTVLVVFLPPGTAPILGMTTLEIFGLAINPISQELIPVDGLLKEMKKGINYEVKP